MQCRTKQTRGETELDHEGDTPLGVAGIALARPSTHPPTELSELILLLVRASCALFLFTTLRRGRGHQPDSRPAPSARYCPPWRVALPPRHEASPRLPARPRETADARQAGETLTLAPTCAKIYPWYRPGTGGAICVPPPPCLTVLGPEGDHPTKRLLHLWDTC